MAPTVIPVMEGDGDATALPLLLQRILYERLGRFDTQIGQGPQGRVNAKNRPQLETQLGKYLLHAQRKPDCSGILVLIDADDDCPLGLAQTLRKQQEASGVTTPVEIVCAKHEYETWFLASLRTIRGRAGIYRDAQPASPVEAQGSPKGWLTRHMPKGRAYKPTAHQLSFTNLIDLQLAYDNSRSFRRLCHALEQLLDAIPKTK